MFSNLVGPAQDRGWKIADGLVANGAAGKKQMNECVRLPRSLPATRRSASGPNVVIHSFYVDACSPVAFVFACFAVRPIFWVRSRVCPKKYAPREQNWKRKKSR